MTNYTAAVLFEHRFWLQVLGDHARFIKDSLSPDERDEIQSAEYFINIFDQLLIQARQPLTDVKIDALNREAFRYAKEIRAFKLDLIKQHLVGDIKIELPPTFLNHMVNEVDEYLRVLGYLMQNQALPVSHPVHHHLIWLLDAAGHASAITGSLDMVEKRLMETSDTFNQHFEEYYIKAVEMAGYMRTSLKQFPALSRFNFQVEAEIVYFKLFLRELLEMEMSNKVLSTLSPLMPDHMLREECYYLIKLAQSSEVKMPDCDPTRPRVES